MDLMKAWTQTVKMQAKGLATPIKPHLHAEWTTIDSTLVTPPRMPTGSAPTASTWKDSAAPLWRLKKAATKSIEMALIEPQVRMIKMSEVSRQTLPWSNLIPSPNVSSLSTSSKMITIRLRKKHLTMTGPLWSHLAIRARVKISAPPSWTRSVPHRDVIAITWLKIIISLTTEKMVKTRTTNSSNLNNKWLNLPHKAKPCPPLDLSLLLRWKKLVNQADSHLHLLRRCTRQLQVDSLVLAATGTSTIIIHRVLIWCRLNWRSMMVKGRIPSSLIVAPSNQLINSNINW